DLSEWQRPRVDRVDRGNGHFANFDRRQARIHQGVPEASEFATSVGLHLGVDAGATPRSLDRVADDAREIRDVARAQGQADVAGRDRAVAGEHADTEGERVVFTR